MDRQNLIDARENDHPPWKMQMDIVAALALGGRLTTARNGGTLTGQQWARLSPPVLEQIAT